MSDFGIAAAAHQTASLKTVNASGSPVYMAPEHIAGKPRPASDQYSLGIVVYEWLCGMPPFQGEPMAVMYQQTYAPVPPLSEQAKKPLTSNGEQILLQALAKDPQDRFTNIMAFADALNLENFVTKVEGQLMLHFIVGMRERTISVAQSRQCARDFLALLPFKSKGDVLEKLKKLGQMLFVE